MTEQQQLEMQLEALDRIRRSIEKKIEAIKHAD